MCDVYQLLVFYFFLRDNCFKNPAHGVFQTNLVFDGIQGSPGDRGEAVICMLAPGFLYCFETSHDELCENFTCCSPRVVDI